MSPFALCVSISAYVLLVIVMMNLLIAIVNSAYERVTTNSVVYTFKEKVDIICDVYDVYN